MPFLGLFELLIAHAPRIEQPMAQPLSVEVPLVQLPREQQIEVLPFVIEGSVDNFDPIKRAKELINTIPRKWCGTYRSFNDDSNFEVILYLAQSQLIGQIVSLEGEILINEKSEFQQVTLIQSKRYGKGLLLDGCWMTSEKQERHYHECLVHPALSSAYEIKKSVN